MPADAKAIKAIFLDALDKPAPADRAAFLEQACGGNSDLRRSVEALLKSHESPDALLDQPAVKHVAAEAEEVSLDFLEPSTAPGALGCLGHYDVLEVVGRGGMGIVVRAFDQKLRRVVAIKVLAPSLAENGAARQRFVREARAAAAVTHQNVIAIHGVEDTGPVPYLVMQYIDGKTLQEKLDATGSLELKEILRIGLQVAEGLAAAHRHGLIHRDIKPANILLENGIERVKITDFGLARSADDASLTQSGYIAGTPLFMSPEQARGEHVDHRTDLFSLGTVLYAMCAGHPPFRANSSMAVLKRVCDDAPRPVREINPAIPEWLDAIVDRLHQKDPVDRFATAQEVVGLLSRGLNQVQTGAAPNTTLRGLAPRRRARRGRWAAALVAVLAIVGAGVAVGYFTRDRGPRPDSTVEATPAPQPASAPEPWKPRPPLTPDELGGLQDPLDEWRREGIQPSTRALIGDEAKDALPGMVGLLGDGPFRLAPPEITHWPAESADGRLLALPSGSDVNIYDAETGEFRRKLVGHTDRAFRGAFSSDGKRYACGAQNEAIRVWDVESGEEKGGVLATGEAMWATRFAPGDKQIVFSGDKGRMKVWDGAAGTELKTFAEHKGGIHHFAFSPDGTRLVSGGMDGVVEVWSWPDGALVKALEQERDSVLSVAYSADGSLFATGSTSLVRIWDSATFQPLHKLETAGDGLVAFTPDGQTLVTAPHRIPAGRKRAFTRWDVKSGVPSIAFEVPGPRSLLVGGLSRDGRTIYLMSCVDPVESRLGAYDAVSGKERFPNQSGARDVYSVAFSPDGRWLASAGNDGRISLWDLARRPAGEFVSPARRLIAHTGTFTHVAFSPDGQLLAAGSMDGTIRRCKVADDQELPILTGYSLQDANLAFSPDGETLAAGNRYGGVNLWNVMTGEPGGPLRWHADRVRAVAFSPDGKWLASGGFDDKTVQLIDRASGHRVDLFRGESPFTGLTFSADSRTLAAVAAAPRQLLHVWDVATRKGQTFGGHTQNVWAIAFHPDGKRIATASADGTVRLWESVPGGYESRKFDFRRFGSPSSVAFTPSGRHLAVGLRNGMIAILETPAVPGRK